MIRRIFPLAVAAFLVACTGGSAEDPTGVADPALSAIAPGTFAMTERAGGHLSPFGCRHYMELQLGGDIATIYPVLDSADPKEMEENGSCGGEEIPSGSTSRYPLGNAHRTECGALVMSGTIKWTESGAVKRTMTVTDYRGAHCAGAPARVVAEIVSTYHGETNPIATYYSVDDTK